MSEFGYHINVCLGHIEIIGQGVGEGRKKKFKD